MNLVRMNKGAEALGVSKNTFRKMARESNAIITYGNRIKFVDLDLIIENGKKEDRSLRKGDENKCG